jgi:hypothetical protein
MTKGEISGGLSPLRGRAAALSAKRKVRGILTPRQAHLKPSYVGQRTCGMNAPSCASDQCNGEALVNEDQVMIGSRKGVAVGLLMAMSVVAGTAGTASAKSGYDGAWSVVISAESGVCSGAYRYPVAIVNGNVRHASVGDHPFNISGRVGTDGRVTVQVSRGDLRANGSGRLSGASGGGTWQSPSGCSGRWQAARRG